jgi:hypothetical protein
MTAPVKNPTQWMPTSGQGYVITNVPNQTIVTNTLKSLVDNTSNHYPIVTQASYVVPKNPTLWTQTGQ